MAGPQRRFAPALAAKRKLAGLSMSEAADLAGVSRTLWRQMEDPERPYQPRRDSVVKAARVLRWDLDEALPLAGHGDPPTDAERAAAQAGPRDDLDRLLRDLTDSQMRALVILVRSILYPQAPIDPGYPTDLGGEPGDQGDPERRWDITRIGDRTIRSPLDDAPDSGPTAQQSGEPPNTDPPRS